MGCGKARFGQRGLKTSYLQIMLSQILSPGTLRGSSIVPGGAAVISAL